MLQLIGFHVPLKSFLLHWRESSKVEVSNEKNDLDTWRGIKQFFRQWLCEKKFLRRPFPETNFLKATSKTFSHCLLTLIQTAISSDAYFATLCTNALLRLVEWNIVSCVFIASWPRCCHGRSNKVWIAAGKRLSEWVVLECCKVKQHLAEKLSNASPVWRNNWRVAMESVILRYTVSLILGSWPPFMLVRCYETFKRVSKETSASMQQQPPTFF